jgi:hypothetical protein
MKLKDDELFVALTRKNIPSPDFIKLGPNHLTLSIFENVDNLDLENLPSSREIARSFRIKYDTEIMRQAHVNEFVEELNKIVDSLRQKGNLYRQCLFHAQHPALLSLRADQYSFEKKKFEIVFSDEKTVQLGKAIFKSKKFDWNRWHPFNFGSYGGPGRYSLDLPADPEMADQLIKWTKDRPASLDIIFSPGGSPPLQCTRILIKAIRLTAKHEDDTFVFHWLFQYSCKKTDFGDICYLEVAARGEKDTFQ